MMSAVITATKLPKKFPQFSPKLSALSDKKSRASLMNAIPTSKIPISNINKYILTIMTVKTPLTMPPTTPPTIPPVLKEMLNKMPNETENAISNQTNIQLSLDVKQSVREDKNKPRQTFVKDVNNTKNKFGFPIQQPIKMLIVLPVISILLPIKCFSCSRYLIPKIVVIIIPKELRITPKPICESGGNISTNLCKVDIKKLG
ncbi:hypothetical protein [Pseudanabaena minima]|uniref:hypothetical protein n=1 Tax=Pseudanabaena minima TaxID=890415 RepID=UPI003DA9A8C3